MPSPAEYRERQIGSLQTLSALGNDDERTAVRYAISAISTEVALSARVKELAQENAELRDEIKRRSDNEDWLAQANRKLHDQLDRARNGSEVLRTDLEREQARVSALNAKCVAYEELVEGRDEQLEILKRSYNWLEKRNLWLNGEIDRLKAARPSRTAIPDWRTKPPTEKQIAWMEGVGMDPTGYNRGQIADLVGFAKRVITIAQSHLPQHDYKDNPMWEGWWNE